MKRALRNASITSIATLTGTCTGSRIHASSGPGTLSFQEDGLLIKTNDGGSNKVSDKQLGASDCEPTYECANISGAYAALNMEVS